MFEVKTGLELMEYIFMVRDIVDGFFGDEGEYLPHMGKVNTMRLFYNSCIVHEEGYEPITDLLDMDEIVKNPEFIEQYNKVIAPAQPMAYDFSNAYVDALEIVNARIYSYNNITVMLSNALNTVMVKISEFLSDDKISALSQIAKDISNGKIDQSVIANLK